MRASQGLTGLTGAGLTGLTGVRRSVGRVRRFVERAHAQGRSLHCLQCKDGFGVPAVRMQGSSPCQFATCKTCKAYEATTVHVLSALPSATNAVWLISLQLILSLHRKSRRAFLEGMQPWRWASAR